ncbi:hypothetical protein E4U10_006772 [Claviceps purpurea]|nr:hypothetical protein E4U10_006772 [Claviceps purpurea]
MSTIGNQATNICHGAVRTFQDGFSASSESHRSWPRNMVSIVKHPIAFPVDRA